MICAAMFLLIAAGAAKGDSIRPAYLEIIETGPGTVEVVWKVPVFPGLPSGLWPALPSSYRPSSPVQKFDSSNAVVYKWTMLGGTLRGHVIRVQELDAFTMDALLRIELQDGTTLRTILRPAAPAFELPADSDATLILIGAGTGMGGRL